MFLCFASFVFSLVFTFSFFITPYQLTRIYILPYFSPWSVLGGSVVKNPPANTGDTGSIPGSGRSSGEGNGNPLQYSCLENPMDRGAWPATVRGVAKESDTT